MDDAWIDLAAFQRGLQSGGIIGILGLLVWMLVMGWLVPKWAYTALREWGEKWQQTAHTATDVSERALVELQQVRQELEDTRALLEVERRGSERRQSDS